MMTEKFGETTKMNIPIINEKINMRRMLLYCRNEISSILGDFVASPNDEETRTSVVKRVNILMEDIQKGGWITSYQILCDETLNTEEVIRNSELKLKVTIFSKLSLSNTGELPVCLSFTISADTTTNEPDQPLVTLN